MLIVSLISLVCQPEDIAFKKRHIKVEFVIFMGFLAGDQYFYTFGTLGKFLVI